MRLKLGRILGIDIFLHWTFFLAPIYLIYAWRQEGLPWSMVAILLGLLVAVFTCVLIHEYGHALMARRFGVETQDIIITPIGGLARLQGMPRRPIEEFLITLAGPMVNLVIAIIFFVFLLATGRDFLPSSGYAGLKEFAPMMLWMNLVLFFFNLIPAFPMDGGRLLRSSLAFFIPHMEATMVAGILGQICAVIFALIGVFSGQYSLLLIGVFIIFAARYEMKVSRMIWEHERALKESELYRSQNPVVDGAVVGADIVGRKGVDGVTVDNGGDYLNAAPESIEEK